MTRAVAAALYDGQSMQAPQLRDERKHGRRRSSLAAQITTASNSPDPTRSSTSPASLVREDEVLQADAGRVQQLPRPCAAGPRPRQHYGAPPDSAASGTSSETLEHLAVRPLATERHQPMRINADIRGDEDSRKVGLTVVLLVGHGASLLARRTLGCWPGRPRPWLLTRGRGLSSGEVGRRSGRSRLRDPRRAPPLPPAPTAPTGLRREGHRRRLGTSGPSGRRRAARPRQPRQCRAADRLRA